MFVAGGSRLGSRSACSTTMRWTLQCSFSGIRRPRPLIKRSHISDDNDEQIRTKEEFQFDCHSAQPITWYPGHIAKAERELAEYLKKVDVVIEVRDARIPISTTHPMVPEWVGNKPLIVVIARIDQISRRALDNWRQYYTDNPVHVSRPDAKVFFIDGKLGAGIVPLKRETLKAGIALNERREKRGIQPRSVRAAIIGFPNVGKSALINRLLGKKMATSRNLAGVTKALTWVRLGGLEVDREDGIELLDSPGIIPARQLDQEAAMKLAICNDIGEASYDRTAAAAAMCDAVIKLHNFQRGYVDMQRINDRYELPFETLSGEDLVYEVAQKFYRGNITAASDKLLGDFRRGFMGYCSLEAPGMVEKIMADKKEERKKQNSIKNNLKVIRQQESHRSDYVTKYDIGDKIFKDEIGDVIIRKNKKPISLDLFNGNYEGW